MVALVLTFSLPRQLDFDTMSACRSEFKRAISGAWGVNRFVRITYIYVYYTEKIKSGIEMHRKFLILFGFSWTLLGTELVFDLFCSSTL